MKTIEEKAAEIVEKARVITLASIDGEGYPRPVPMAKLSVNKKGVIYTSTASSSEKVECFKKNSKAGLSIFDDDNSIVYTGNIEVVTDKNEKQAQWQEWMINHFTKGPNDPEYCLLKFTPIKATYWIDNEFIKK